MKNVPFSKQGSTICCYLSPTLNKLSSIIHRNLFLLYMNQEVKNVFTSGSVESFKSARKISSYLVRAKLYPLERNVGSEKCRKSRCEVLNFEKIA